MSLLKGTLFGACVTPPLTFQLSLLKKSGQQFHSLTRAGWSDFQSDVRMLQRGIQGKGGASETKSSVAL